MQVSSIEQSYLASLYTEKLYNTTASTADLVNTPMAIQSDSVSLSSGVQQLPPPPHEMDFESMTDDELKDYLQQMYNVTGTLPSGMEGTVEDLSEETLSEVREILVDMSQNDPISKTISEASSTTSGISGENYKSLLTMFLLNMQNSLTSFGSSSSDEDDSWFGSSNNDLLTQTLSQYLASNSTDEDTQSIVQQALAAYEQNML